MISFLTNSKAVRRLKKKYLFVSFLFIFLGLIFKNETLFSTTGDTRKLMKGEIELLQQRMTRILFILFPKIKLQNAKFQDKEIEFAE